MLGDGGLRHAARGAVRDHRHRPDAAGVLRRARAPTTSSCGRGCSTKRRSTTTRGSSSPSTTSSTATPGGRSRASSGTCCPLSGLEDHLPQGQPARHGAAHARLPRARLDLRLCLGVVLPAMWLVSRAARLRRRTTRSTRAARAAGSTSCSGRRCTSRSSSRSRCSSAASGSARCGKSLGSGAIFAMACRTA